MLNKTVWCVWVLLEDNHRFTITNITMAAHFSHEADEAVIVNALQQLEMHKVCPCCVPWQLMEEHQKIALEWYRTRRMGMTYSSEYK